MTGSLRHRDRGSVMILVLVATIVLSLIVVATARFVSADLRFATVVEDRAEALVTAESGLDHAIQRIQRNATACAFGGPAPIHPTPQPINGSDLTVTCEPLGGAQSYTAWAAVTTGIGSVVHELRVAGTGTTSEIDGPLFMNDPQSTDGVVPVVNGDLFYNGTDCGSALEIGNLESGILPDLISPPARAPSVVCTAREWNEVVREPPVPPGLETLPVIPPDGYATVGGCRVFPAGRYDTVPQLGSDNYFESGVSYFNNVTMLIEGTSPADRMRVWAGHPADTSYVPTAGTCTAARNRDGLNDGRGATWYLGGSSAIVVSNQADLELMPMIAADGGRNVATSVHVLGPGSIQPSTLTGADTIVGVRRPIVVDSSIIIHGGIWAPRQRVRMGGGNGGAPAQLLGGVVAASLRGNSNAGFVARRASNLEDVQILIRSTAVRNGVSVEARAVVEYRAGAAFDERIAVTSYRIVES